VHSGELLPQQGFPFYRLTGYQRVAVTLDLMMSSEMGRPVSMHDDECVVSSVYARYALKLFYPAMM
jgi:hypothetical protein